jgi:ferritin
MLYLNITGTIYSNHIIMKIKPKVEEVLNKQINAEFWSAYLYLSMSAYFETRALKGFASWMKIQYQEEVTHAVKLFDYINSRGGVVKLEPINSVSTSWSSILDVFQDTYSHECEVTAMINNCYEVANNEKDHAAANMLQWFISEQSEEEQNALQIIDQLNLIGQENGQAIYHLDKELGARVFVDSTQTVV